MVGAIKKSYQIKKYMPEFKRMRTGTLEKMLTDAQSLESEMLRIVGFDASDENLLRLDKLQHVVEQLKGQIASRARL